MYVLPLRMQTYWDESGSFHIVFCDEPGLEVDESICTTREFKYRGKTYTIFFSKCSIISKRGECLEVILS